MPDEALISGVPVTKPDVPYRPDDDVSDALRDDSVVPGKRIVVQKQGQDLALGHSF